jgi:hypothetical protein
MWMKRDTTFSLRISLDVRVGEVQVVEDEGVSPGDDGPCYRSIRKTVCGNQEEI